MGGLLNWFHTALAAYVVYGVRWKASARIEGRLEAITSRQRNRTANTKYRIDLEPKNLNLMPEKKLSHVVDFERNNVEQTSVKGG